MGARAGENLRGPRSIWRAGGPRTPLCAALPLSISRITVTRYVTNYAPQTHREDGDSKLIHVGTRLSRSGRTADVALQLDPDQFISDEYRSGEFVSAESVVGMFVHSPPADHNTVRSQAVQSGTVFFRRLARPC